MTRTAPFALFGSSFSAPIAGTVLLVLGVSACNPTVRVEGPREPITINLNVKVDADIRVKLEEQADEDIAERDDIF